MGPSVRRAVPAPALPFLRGRELKTHSEESGRESEQPSWRGREHSAFEARETSFPNKHRSKNRRQVNHHDGCVTLEYHFRTYACTSPNCRGGVASRQHKIEERPREVEPHHCCRQASAPVSSPRVGERSIQEPSGVGEWTTVTTYQTTTYPPSSTSPVPNVVPNVINNAVPNVVNGVINAVPNAVNGVINANVIMTTVPMVAVSNYVSAPPNIVFPNLMDPTMIGASYVSPNMANGFPMVTTPIVINPVMINPAPINTGLVSMYRSGGELLDGGGSLHTLNGVPVVVPIKQKPSRALMM